MRTYQFPVFITVDAVDRQAAEAEARRAVGGAQLQTSAEVELDLTLGVRVDECKHGEQYDLCEEPECLEEATK